MLKCRKAKERVILQLCGGLIAKEMKSSGVFKMLLSGLKSKKQNVWRFKWHDFRGEKKKSNCSCARFGSLNNSVKFIQLTCLESILDLVFLKLQNVSKTEK